MRGQYPQRQEGYLAQEPLQADGPQEQAQTWEFLLQLEVWKLLLEEAAVLMVPLAQAIGFCRIHSKYGRNHRSRTEILGEASAADLVGDTFCLQSFCPLWTEPLWVPLRYIARLHPCVVTRTRLEFQSCFDVNSKSPSSFFTFFSKY